MIWDWNEAANEGIISPAPIIFDHDNRVHRGNSVFEMGEGFWIHAIEGTNITL